MKKLTKKQLNANWKTKTTEVENAYNLVRREAKKIGTILPPFKESEGFKIIERKKDRAEKRFEKRDEINAKRRAKYREQREIDIAKGRAGGAFQKLDDVTVWEAYSGNGRIFENEMRNKYKDNPFFGEVLFRNKKHVFGDINKYSIFVNTLLRKLYSKIAREGSDMIFLWRVIRQYFFDPTNNTFYTSHKFYKQSAETNEDDIEI